MGQGQSVMIPCSLYDVFNFIFEEVYVLQVYIFRLLSCPNTPNCCQMIEFLILMSCNILSVRVFVKLFEFL